MSELKVNKISPATGTDFTVGDSGDTFTVPSGATLTTTAATVNLPTTITSTTEVKTNKISPATGTAFTLGDSGDTFTVPSGASITNSGTATGFGGGSWTFIKTVTASSDADVTFVNGVSSVVFDSTYIMYKVVGLYVAGATDDAKLHIRWSTDAGSSYITADYQTQYLVETGSSLISYSKTADGLYIDATGTSTGEDTCFQYDFYNPSQTASYPKANFMTSSANQTSAGGIYVAGMSQNKTAQNIDAFQIIMNSGDIANGSFYLYGLKGS